MIGVSLDWMLAHYPPPSILKIDVEGAEMEVLQGSTNLFSSARPIVLCEVGTETQEQVTGFFHARSYRLYDAEQISDRRDVIAIAAWNTIAVPF